MDEPKFGVHSVDMLKIANSALKTILAIEAKHHRDNTEDYKKICNVHESLFTLLKKYGLV